MNGCMKLGNPVPVIRTLGEQESAHPCKPMIHQVLQFAQ